MEKLEIDIAVAPFRLPNYLLLGVPGREDIQIDAGSLTDDQASLYWESMHDMWTEHVKARRANLTSEVQP